MFEGTLLSPLPCFSLLVSVVYLPVQEDCYLAFSLDCSFPRLIHFWLGIQRISGNGARQDVLASRFKVQRQQRGGKVLTVGRR